MKAKKIAVVLVAVLLIATCLLCSCSREPTKLTEKDLINVLQYKGLERLTIEIAMSYAPKVISLSINIPQGYEAVLYSSRELKFEVRDDKQKIHYLNDERKIYYLDDNGVAMPQGGYFYTNDAQAYVLVCLVRDGGCYGYAIIDITPRYDMYAEWNNIFIVRNVQVFNDSKPWQLQEVKESFNRFLEQQSV